MNSNEGLKRCPFCWGEADALEQIYGYLVRCRECQASLQVYSSYKEQAIASWNHREPEVHSSTKEIPKTMFISVGFEGLTEKEVADFLSLYDSKKSALNMDEIVNLWNRFITKPSQFVTYKHREKRYE